uniref:SAM dependent methyltransferase n=1 Tax=Marseillevirus LCMAC101 TaxID=2506602 RepID=A0A481YSG0_9VIRU|nr:MAG: SAM dependent methyltransferase [Marseillevirus LCMAC101]
MIRDIESCPPIDGLINRIKLLTHDQLIENFYPVKTFIELSNKFNQIIRKHHKKWNRNDLLDIGCGNMIFTRQLAYVLSTVSRGIDISDGRLIKEQNERFTIFDGISIPYKDESVKFITLIHVLHHIEESDNLIKEIHRILKPGGILIIGEFDCWSWKQAYSLNLYHFAMNKVLNTAPSTCWYRPLKQWRTIITNTGFDHLPGETVYDPPNIYHWFYDFYRKPQPKKKTRWDEIPDIEKKDELSS